LKANHVAVIAELTTGYHDQYSVRTRCNLRYSTEQRSPFAARKTMSPQDLSRRQFGKGAMAAAFLAWSFPRTEVFVETARCFGPTCGRAIAGSRRCRYSKHSRPYADARYRFVPADRKPGPGSNHCVHWILCLRENACLPSANEPGTDVRENRP
jgi:hypothetical protein